MAGAKISQLDHGCDCMPGPLAHGWEYCFASHYRQNGLSTNNVGQNDNMPSNYRNNICYHGKPYPFAGTHCSLVAGRYFDICLRALVHVPGRKRIVMNHEFPDILYLQKDFTLTTFCNSIYAYEL